MRWQNRRQSSNVEDRRGRSSGPVGGEIPIPLGLFRGKTLIIVIALLIFLRLFGVGQLGGLLGEEQEQLPAQQDEMKQFVSVVLAETEDV